MPPAGTLRVLLEGEVDEGHRQQAEDASKRESCGATRAVISPHSLVGIPPADEVPQTPLRERHGPRAAASSAYHRPSWLGDTPPIVRRIQKHLRERWIENVPAPAPHRLGGRRPAGHRVEHDRREPEAGQPTGDSQSAAR